MSFNTTLICKPFTVVNFTPLVKHPCLLVSSKIKKSWSWDQVTVNKQIDVLFFKIVQDIPRPLKYLCSVYNLETTQVNWFLTA